MFFGLFNKPAPPWRPPKIVDAPLFKPRIVTKNGYLVLALPGHGDAKMRQTALVQVTSFHKPTAECVRAAQEFVRRRNRDADLRRALAVVQS